MDKISVIIPCYNSGRTILKTLQSVFEQTWKNIEIIIVNDGSSDSFTKKVLKNINNVTIINQTNKGLPSARNTGIKNSSGKYLVFLDADDWIENKTIEIMYKSLRKNKTGYVFCDTYLEGANKGKSQKCYNLFEQLFLNHLPYFILINKELLIKVGCYDEKMRLGYEDWELNIRLGKQGYLPKKINQLLFHYNVSASGMLVSISKRKHAYIFKYIKNKHKDLYSISGIFTIFIKWRRRKKNYNFMIYFILYFSYYVMPNLIFNKFFHLLHVSKIKLYGK